MDAILSKPDPMTDDRSNCTNRFVSDLKASIIWSPDNVLKSPPNKTRVAVTALRSPLAFF